MSNEKFTQGEWIISTEDDDCFIVRDKNGGFVCYGGCFDPNNKSEVKAAKKDICLIAAAPDLYNALKDLVGNSRENWQEVNVSRETINNALKALKKARGEE